MNERVLNYVTLSYFDGIHEKSVPALVYGENEKQVYNKAVKYVEDHLKESFIHDFEVIYNPVIQ